MANNTFWMCIQQDTVCGSLCCPAELLLRLPGLCVCWEGLSGCFSGPGTQSQNSRVDFLSVISKLRAPGEPLGFPSLSYVSNPKLLCGLEECKRPSPWLAYNKDSVICYFCYLNALGLNQRVACSQQCVWKGRGSPQLCYYVIVAWNSSLERHSWG